MLRLLQRRGRLDDADEVIDELGALQARSMQQRLAPSAEPARRSRRSAFLDGFSLHAGVRIHPGDRAGLERLCVYGARGALSAQRLAELPDGRVSYRMKRPAPDGSTHLVLAPHDFLARIAALVPPPRVHLTRFHGVFAPAARRRRSIVPQPSHAPQRPEPELPPVQPALLSPAPVRDVPVLARNRVPWAELLRRVFGIDVLACSACGGRMRVIAYLEDPAVVRKILLHLGLPADPPPLGRARDPPADWAD